MGACPQAAPILRDAEAQAVSLEFGELHSHLAESQHPTIPEKRDLCRLIEPSIFLKYI